MSMRIFRKGVQGEVRKYTVKLFNLLVVLALIFQPVGTVGLYGAFSYGQGIAVAADEAPEEAVGVEEVKSEADAPKEEEEVTPTDEPAPSEEEVIPEEVPVIPTTEEDVTPTPETMPEEVEETPVVEVPEVIPTEEGEEEAAKPQPVEESEWIKGDDGRYTTTKAVVLGTTYVAPQNKDVTVVFTKLPEHPGTLSIDEVKLSPEQVAELNAFSDTAYDVTSSMEDGTFEYVLSLPVPAYGRDMIVKYAEDLAGLNQPKVVSDADTKEKQGTIQVALDHFTLFIATYGDVAFSVDKSEYVPGETIYLKATGLKDTKYYRMALDPPTGGEIFTMSCFNPGEGVSELTDTYTFSVEAVLGNWGAEIKEYSNSNCTGGHDDVADPFTVVAPVEEEHVPVTICHATPPDTATNGYTKIVTDDDGVLNQGHGTQHSADIIPPFTVGELEFPGQNWTSFGQALWSNDCEPTGRLKVLKVADDNADLTQWSFALGEGVPVAANASGEVDFGYVDTGVYTVSEISIASYSVSDVSGEGCVWDEEAETVSATVTHGVTTTCTFFNSVDRASLTLVKEALPESEQDFRFFINELESEFSLDDDGNEENELSRSKTFSSLMPGSYTVTEESVEGWQLTGLACESSRASLQVTLDETVVVTLAPGEHVTCTYTNSMIADESICGDGIINQESEQCDGMAGVTEGENFCTTSCQLVPIYDGGGTCAKGKEKVVVGSYFVSGTTNSEGISIPLSGGKEYILEAKGDYSYGGVATNHVLNRADAGYSSDDNFSGPNLLNTLFGIQAGAFYRGVHTLISDMGTGTYGVVDWGDYQSDHVYPVAISPEEDTEIRFAIADWYDEWYSGDWLSEPNKNQQGYRDNEGGLTVDVYECQDPEEAKGSITIIKDAQPDSPQDFGYAMTGNGFVEFVLDDDTDELLSNTVTMTELPAGTYTVTEGLVAGWELEDISCTSNQRSLATSTDPVWTLDLLPGEEVVCTFKNVLQATVPVCGDGILNQESEACDGTAGVTEGKNFCTFSCSLVPIYDGGGTCSEGTERVLVGTKFIESYMTDNVVPAPVTVSLEAGKEYIVESVGDFGYGGVNGNNSLNRADAGYVSDSNWANPNLDTLFGTPATALYRGIHSLISDMGTGTFGVVNWGAYSAGHAYSKQFTPAVNTDVQFAISDWYDTWYSGDELSNINKNQFGFRDNEGGLTLNIYECQPQEEENPSRLELRKSNNSVGDETPGNEVVYTLEVTALDGPVDDVTVTDLPPEGFAYVAGSGEGAPFIHEYASPGIWDLGDMAEGETKTLTYRTTISESQDSGLYRDLAFAKGVSGEEAIFANSVADPFVGTAVNVVNNTTETVVVQEDDENKLVEKTKKKTQYVLGAATTLPMTGVPLGTVVLALLGLILGLGLIFTARRRVMMPVIALMMLSGAFFPHTADAASLSVKIETPEAVTDTADIKIGFVTLDVLGRSLSVECYRDSDVAPFATYNLASAFGGNSGDCQVDGSVMPTDGTYEFYVKAIASGEGSETVESNHVSVTLASETPGTPTNYERDDASCQNVITFTTADDGGKTVKVELYRSFSTTFVADAGTFVAELALGSNQAGNFSIPAPGCSNDAYYAIRAVAVNGNGSGFVGDKDTDVDTHTVTKNKTTTVTLPGGNVSGAIPVTNTTVGTPEGQVEGVTDEEGDSNTETTPEPSVLGDMTEAGVDAVTNHPWRSFFWLVTVLVVAYFVYQWYRSKDHDQSAN